MDTQRLPISLAAVVLIAACSSTPARVLAPDPVPSFAARSVTPAAHEREVRYYTDSQGMLWDDRGRNLGRPPIPAAALSP
jgi:hypothetical protein